MTDLTRRSANELIDLARTDGNKLGLLLERYRSYLTMLGRLQIDERLQGKLDASDLVQEAFLETHNHFAKFRGTSEAELMAWLRRILASKVTAVMRRFYEAKGRDLRLERRLEEQMHRSAQMAHDLAISQTSPSERAVRRECAVLLADALDALPSDYRQVVMLHDLKELGFTEIAQTVGRSADAVRKLWIRALAELNRLLAQKLSDAI